MFFAFLSNLQISIVDFFLVAWRKLKCKIALFRFLIYFYSKTTVSILLGYSEKVPHYYTKNLSFNTKYLFKSKVLMNKHKLWYYPPCSQGSSDGSYKLIPPLIGCSCMISSTRRITSITPSSELAPIATTRSVEFGKHSWKTLMFVPVV